MDKLLIYRERILKFISSKGKLIQFSGRFLCGLILFFVVSNIYGYVSLLSEPFIFIVLGLVCVFLSNSVIFLLYQFIVTVELAAVSLEISLVYIVLMVLYYLIYQRVVPRGSILFLMTPIFFYFHIPAVLPIFVGSFVGLIGLPAILMGTFQYYLAIVMQEAVLRVENGTGSGEIYSLVLKGTSGNKELLLCILVFILVAALVAGIRKMGTAYGWYIAILFGGVMYLLSILTGGYFLNSEVNIIKEIIMILVSICIVMIIQFFYNVIDYTRQETFEFEDEEYYYYVKAIPKISMEEEEINVTKINVPSRRFYLKKKEKNDEGEQS